MAKSRRTTGDVGGATTLADHERLQSGFDATNWNAAVSLQCAVRDYIERPVTLEQALRIVTRSIRDRDMESFTLIAWRKIFDDEVVAREREKAAARQRELESIHRS